MAGAGCTHPSILLSANKLYTLCHRHMEPALWAGQGRGEAANVGLQSIGTCLWTMERLFMETASPTSPWAHQDFYWSLCRSVRDKASVDSTHIFPTSNSPALRSIRQGHAQDETNSWHLLRMPGWRRAQHCQGAVSRSEDEQHLLTHCRASFFPLLFMTKFTGSHVKQNEHFYLSGNC